MLKNSCFRILSQFFYPIIFIVIVLICSFYMKSRKFTISVSKSSIFEEENDPIWVVHMTDLHISSSFPQAIIYANESFHFINQYIKPPFLLITGDVVDNYESSKRPCKSYQIESQFQKYNELIKLSGVINYTFETIGNHDVVGISKSVNDNHQTNFHKYFHVNNTCISTVKEKGNIRIISFNPVDFTSGTGLLGLVKKIDSHNLDPFEEAIADSCQNTSQIKIVISHYTTTTLYPQMKTSSGSSFGELFERCNIKYFLNGHIHPKTPRTLHHKNGFTEFTGTASKVYGGFAVFSVDNGHPNYFQMNSQNDRPAVLTYPVPSKYENEVMKEFSGFVRIISYSNKASQFNVTVENQKSKEKVDCQLQFVRNLTNSIENKSEVHYPRLFQCKLPNIGYNGENALKIEGDLNETIEFNVNKPFKVTEKHVVLFVSFGFIVGISFAIIYHTIIVIGLFLPFSNDFFGNYLEKPFFCVLLGPLVTGHRMRKLFLCERIFLAFLILSPIFMPVDFFKSGGDRGFMLFWGYLFNSEFTWDTFLVGFASLYFFTATIAIEEIFIILMSKWDLSYLFDIIVSAVFYAIALYGWYFFGIEVSCGAVWFASFPFILYPICAVVLAVVHIFLDKKVDPNDASGLSASFLLGENDENRFTP